MRHLIICLTFVFFITLPYTNAINLVPETCTKISKSNPKVTYEFCVKVLGSDPRSSTATLEQLAEISFQIDILKAEAVTILIQKLLHEPKLVIPVIKRALQDCLQVYSDATDELEDGLEAVKAKDYKTANVKGSAALSYAETCKEGFQNGQGMNPSPSPSPSPTTPFEVDFLELVGISLALTNML